MSAPVARRYFARAKEQLRAGDLDAATQSFAAAVELAPYFVEARVGAALTLARTDPPRAAQLLRTGLRGLTRASHRRLVLVALGDVLTAAGDFPGADEAYAQASQLPGRHPLASRLARLQAKTGRYAEALATLPPRATSTRAIRSRMTVVLSTPPFDSAARTSASHASSSDPSVGVGEHLLEHPVVDHVGQPVAAEQVHVARLHRDDAMIDLDLIAQPDRAHDHVRVRRAEARRQLGVVLVQVDERVVARDLLELALPQAVDARVADVREVQKIRVLANRHHRRAHVVQRRIGLRFAEHRLVRRFDRRHHLVGVVTDGAVRRADHFTDGGYRELRRDLSADVTTHAVAHDVQADRRIDEHRVFILLANQPDIGLARALDAQRHGMKIL